MSENISKALKRRDELRRELHDIDRLIQLYERYVGPVDVPPEQVGNTEQSAESRPRPVRKAGVPALIADAAERVLRDERRPIQRGELAKLIEERGVEIPSDDKPRYLGTVLWRRPETFENIESEGYILRSEPPPGVKASLFDGASEGGAGDGQPSG